MTDLPKFALSVRQPWAWAILFAGKPIENRDWTARNPGLRYRGRAALHASQGMTRDEYEEAAGFIRHVGYTCPHPSALDRGAIIGSVEITGIVHESDSPWFFGPIGLVLANPEPCEPIPCKGALGFFEWKPSDEPMPPRARWMEPKQCVSE